MSGPRHLPITLRTVASLGEVEPTQWDALLDEQANPFVSWAFLEGLERAACVVPERGWLPCHLTAWQEERLVAAAPAYVKGDGMGDFSRDWSLQDLVHSRGGQLYPKLLVGVPFSPVPGRRILVHPGCERAVGVAAIVELARAVARGNQLACVQVLYHHPTERTELAAGGFANRTLIQYHWHNRGYRTFDAWLADLPAKRRTQIRRERRELDLQGITIRTVRGDALRRDSGGLAALAYSLYQTTCDKYTWGGTYLTRAFFELLFERLPDRVELVVAERGGRPVAGALNLATTTHLYGRYWGCFEEHRFLHFNVCLYHSVAECIERGVSVFEGGAGGEHKLARGFLPVTVDAALWFRDGAIDRVVAQALRHDRDLRREQLEGWYAERNLAPRPEQP